MATTTADAERLKRVIARLQSLPSIALPTDYPRPPSHKVVEAIQQAELDPKASLCLLKLALFDDGHDEEHQAAHETQPTPFQMLLSAFTVLLHRYTGDNDLLIGSSSAQVKDPLLLRLSIEPTDPFWAVVRRVQAVEREAEDDAVPFDSIVSTLQTADTDSNSAPLFRVRFFDETAETNSPTSNPETNFIRSTSLTTDLTIFIARPPPSTTSTRSSLVPQILLRVAYNALLFLPQRITLLLDQLSTLLKEVSADPLRPVGTIPLITPKQRAILPDPGADLHWCDWKGAITDVFSRNARAHPDKICVVQSLPPSFNELGGLSDVTEQETVKYSYKDILETSNILAHHLVEGGIQREEVVMVYAYRSVEMVVAVMAILKAGATFSVIGSSLYLCLSFQPFSNHISPHLKKIDPAYPPSRQTTYLRVAKPRGLIVLKGAGIIAPSVRDFIKTELDIRVEVPALELTTEKTILGGVSPSSSSSTSEDVLASSQSLAQTDPLIVLGPDSIGTLSFTSGSTGIPKGVQGRHYSLTHFFPWMGQRFGLDASSKFTMLSGIAHDPIQRDSKPAFFSLSSPSRN